MPFLGLFAYDPKLCRGLINTLYFVAVANIGKLCNVEYPAMESHACKVHNPQSLITFQLS